LTSVNLAENRLVYAGDVSAVIKLAEAFTKMPNLRKVNIASNMIGVEGGMKLAEALPKMPNLREVKCAACAFPCHENAGYPPVSLCTLSLYAPFLSLLCGRPFAQSGTTKYSA